MIKVGFFGTPSIASCCFDDLCEKYDIVFAVTGEDKKAGRKQKVCFCPVKESAHCNDIPILQPDDLNDPQFFEQLKSFNADIFIIVAYGKIIPRKIFDLPRLKTINLHPSLLPHYRGAAPIEWSLIHGEKETGVTVQMINEQLDAGDIVLQEKVAVDINMTASDLYDISIEKGAILLDKAIQELASGNAKLIEQNHDEATYCGKLDKNTAHIDWQDEDMKIHNLVRGLNPKPVAWTTFRDKNIRIFQTAPLDEDVDIDLEPGFLARYHKKRLLVGTGKKCLEILKIQPENKKIMDGLSFINGYRLEQGDHFI